MHLYEWFVDVLPWSDFKLGWKRLGGPSLGSFLCRSRLAQLRAPLVRDLSFFLFGFDMVWWACLVLILVMHSAKDESLVRCGESRCWLDQIKWFDWEVLIGLIRQWRSGLELPWWWLYSSSDREIVLWSLKALDDLLSESWRVLFLSAGRCVEAGVLLCMSLFPPEFSTFLLSSKNGGFVSMLWVAVLFPLWDRIPSSHALKFKKILGSLETSQALGGRLLFWFYYLFTIEISASFFSWPLARFPFSCRGKVLSKDQLKLLDPLVGLTQQVQPWWSSVFNIDLIKHQRKYKIWKPSVSFPEVEWQIAWNFQPLQPWVETIRISDQRQPSKISHGNGSTGKKVNNTRPVEKEYVFLG